VKFIPQIKLFVSSPSDVQQERNAVEDIITQINDNEGLERSFNVTVYRWEKNHTPDGEKYQKQINEELKDTDIFVGILWNRFGTPTDDYQSGTEEEFAIARKRYEDEEKIKTKTKIKICFYRCERKGGFNDKDNEQLEQKQKVNNFFNEKNNKKFSASDYIETEEFKDKFRNNILVTIYDVLKEINDLEKIGKSFNENGIVKLYTPELNDLRNHDKAEFLEKEEGDIYLLAHSGNSYLHSSKDGNPGRFFDDVRSRLSNKQDYKIKVLLLNPYSLEARKIFYAENFHSNLNDISSINDIEAFEQGKNYLRFIQCIQGIDELKTELGIINNNRLEVRITNVATDGTILMSDTRLFYEPYIVSRFLNRIEKGLNLFEIQVRNLLNDKQCPSVYNHQLCKTCADKFVCQKNLYKTLAEQFYILWATSVSLTEYKEQLEKYKDDFSKNQPELFSKQIVQLHDSWLAFDPVIGCGGNCIYCFLGPRGWRNTTPHLRNSPHLRESSNEEKTKYLDDAYKKELLKYKYVNSNDCTGGLRGNIPVSIGNKTDLFSADNKETLKYICALHEKENTKRPLVLITKQEIDLDIIDILKHYSFDVIILYSIAFLPEDFEPNVPSCEERLASARKVREKIRNEDITNICLIHYWRPIVDIFFTKEKGIDYIFKQVQSIFDCSICIRLVITEEIHKSLKSNHTELYNYIKEENNNEDVKNVIYIMKPSFEEIQQVAGKYSYPVFQHTSCALSYVQKKADFNGSMWRENFCNNCIHEQKDRCKTFKKKWDRDDCIALLDKNLRPSISYSLKEDCIKIDSAITQEKINHLTHLIGKPVFSDSVKLTLVWPSSNQTYFKDKYSKINEFDAVKTEYPRLTEQLERLKGITGFISILGNDQRITAFNRYDHVGRVVRLLKWYIHDLENLDLKKCALLGLFHDINRLPFAHNLEKALGFSQAETIRDYMTLFDANLDDYYGDFAAFFNKNLDVSVESRIVYLIDSVDGFMEDPLFALATLNMDYNAIPKDILSILGFDDEAMLKRDIARLSALYNRDIDMFREEFGDMVFEYAKAFIKKHQSDKYKIFDKATFLSLRKKIKDELLVGQIFPINNEIVSKGSKLASEIGKPYIEYLKSNNQDAYATLFKQTDSDLLKQAASIKIIKEEDYYPNLSVN